MDIFSSRSYTAIMARSGGGCSYYCCRWIVRLHFYSIGKFKFLSFPHTLFIRPFCPHCVRYDLNRGAARIPLSRTVPARSTNIYMDTRITYRCIILYVYSLSAGVVIAPDSAVVATGQVTTPLLMVHIHNNIIFRMTTRSHARRPGNRVVNIPSRGVWGCVRAGGSWRKKNYRENAYFSLIVKHETWAPRPPANRATGIPSSTLPNFKDDRILLDDDYQLCTVIYHTAPVCIAVYARIRILWRSA